MLDWAGLQSAHSLLAPPSSCARPGVASTGNGALSGSSLRNDDARSGIPTDVASRFLAEVVSACDEICTAVDLRTASLGPQRGPAELSCRQDAAGGDAAVQARQAAGDLLILASLKGGSGCAATVLDCLIKHAWDDQFARCGSVLMTGTRLRYMTVPRLALLF